MLTHIQIKNFASCEHAEFDLSGPITALVGRNGVGKTNILKAIEWISRRGSLAEPVAYPYPQGGKMASVSVTLLLDEIKYVYTLSFLDSLKQDAKSSDTQSSSLSESLIRERDDFKFIQRRDELVTLPEDHLPKAVTINKTIPVLPLLASFLPAGNALLAVIQPVLNILAGIRYYTLDEPSQAPRDYVLGADYAAWLNKYKSGATQTGSVALRILYMYKEDNDLFREFTALLGQNGLGLVDLSIHEVAQAMPTEGSKEQDSKQSTIYFFNFIPLEGMGGEGKFFFYSNLSAGTRRSMRMLVSLLFDRRSLMLVEQPEDSMHPGLLAKLVDLLRGYSHRTQFVFTTHSPYVLNILNPTEVLLVSAAHGNTSLRRLNETELDAAKHFLEEEGVFSEFLESIEGTHE